MPRPGGGGHGGRPRVGRNGAVYTPRATRQYQEAVRLAALAAGAAPIAGPVAVRARFFVSGRAGDLDNYVKVLLDGLAGAAYGDDSQVVSLSAALFPCVPGEERAEVEVGPAPRAREGAGVSEVEARRP